MRKQIFLCVVAACAGAQLVLGQAHGEGRITPDVIRSECAAGYQDWVNTWDSEMMSPDQIVEFLSDKYSPLIDAAAVRNEMVFSDLERCVQGVRVAQIAADGAQPEAPAEQQIAEQTAPPAEPACAMTPDQALADFDAAYGAERAAKPDRSNPNAPGGMRAQYQYAYYLATRGLELIEPRRECMAQHYGPNHAALEGQRDAARRGCVQLSSNGECTPDYPW